MCIVGQPLQKRYYCCGVRYLTRVFPVELKIKVKITCFLVNLGPYVALSCIDISYLARQTQASFLGLVS